MSTQDRPGRDARAATHRGPPLVALALISAALFAAGVIVSAAAGAGFPSPYDSAAEIQAFFAGHRDAVRVTAFLQFASAVPLAIFTATVVSRLRFLGFDRVPGALIAGAGGLLSAAFLALGALVAWVLSRAEVVGDPALVRALHDLAFATGGPGQVVFLGLLLAGIAVPAAFGRLLPRGVWMTGLLIALIAELSVLALPIEGAAVLLPIARFPALVWLVVVGALLPGRRPGTASAGPLTAPAAAT